MLVYLDSAQERLDIEADRRLDDLALASRLGHVTNEAWGRWIHRPRRSAQAGDTPAPSPAGIDAQVLGLAITARRLVALPGEEPRRMNRSAAT